MTSRLLMVYESFPPLQASGTARVFQFARHLPSFGWHPIVLSMPAAADDPVDHTPLVQLPTSVRAVRVAPWMGPAKDRLARWVNRQRYAGVRQPTAASPNSPTLRQARRVFQPNSAAWRATGLPLWVLHWYLDWAPPSLLKVLRNPELRAVDVVWVSAPPVRHVWLADAISRLLGKPLVVDLRDPWTYGSLWNPRGPWVARREGALAETILTRAARVVVTSPLTEREMARRFPRARFSTITNGFTEQPCLSPLRGFDPSLHLLRYVGSLNERRTPDSLLAGLARACRDTTLRRRLRLEFVGPMAGHEPKITALGLDDVVSCRGPVSHQESLRLMRGSDVNVLLQTIGEGQDVIAGKTFEYLAAGKPILAVVPPGGGDAWLLEQVGGAELAAFDAPDAIAAAIVRSVAQADAGFRYVDRTLLARFERSALTRELSALLDEVKAAAHRDRTGSRPR